MSAIVVISFTVIYHLVTIFMIRKLKLSTRKICICAIIVAMTIVLDSIRFPLPTGATISLCSPIPLMLMALLVDYKLAFMGGWLCGILALILIPVWSLAHWGQFFVEHMICFSCLGYTGLFGINKKYKVLLGVLLASAISIFAHTGSGVLFFSQNAWDGWNALNYSLAYNLSQNVPLFIICGIVVLSLPLNKIKSIIERK
jgi:thiamine transporter